MLKLTDRLARAGAGFLEAKTLEVYINIFVFLALMAVAGLLGAWVVIQAQAMARGMGI